MKPGRTLRKTEGSPLWVSVLKCAVFAVVLACIWLGLNYETLGKYLDARNLRNENLREVEDLGKQLADYRDAKRQLETWGFEAEKSARERFLMVRPGEKLILIDEATEPAEAEPGGAAGSPSLPNPQP